MEQQLVFLGDSVTDCSRKRAERHSDTPAALGNGWVLYSSKKLLARHPNFQFYNRGYAGSQIAELRTQDDWWPSHQSKTVAADVVTLMIGINDVWHPFWKNKPHQIEQSLQSFLQLITILKPMTKTLIVMEPIALPCGDVTQDWWVPLSNLSNGQESVCKALDCHWLPLQTALLKDSQGKHVDYLYDGVHPSDLGHRWLSTQWLNFVVEHKLISY